MAKPAEQRTHILRNGYDYELDENARTRRVSGYLDTTRISPRSRTTQARAGGADRRRSDDGGHYIAARFNGPTDAFNHFAQDANFNRSRYRAVENEWAREKKAGKTVFVKIVPVYEGRSRRPFRINVWFTVDNHERSLKFDNENGANRHGK
ncbi:DNA/RNA non-specific endonuclease [uncultured Sphingomonas sp.]|uniref:DNA/RNA non-specific endonuclease n=1 Tax=uncultured Sphingomonas sp. TaxID=158754 RepID=UPI0026398CC7|nr:DNA/RNA non-specific endonuclease [uncultured Sphingomonas sp.]